MPISVNKQFEAIGDPKRSKVLTAVAVASVLVVTLWPLNPSPKNHVSWLPETGGLKFETAGLVLGKQPIKPTEPVESKSYSVELFLRPARIVTSQTILGFYNAMQTEQLELRQWRDGLLVTHDARVESDKTRTIKFDIDHVLHPGKLVSLIVSSGPDGTKVYVDGHPAQSVPTFKISRSELSGEIVLGNSPVRYDPWIGEIRGFAIYAKELTLEEAAQHYRSWTDLDGHTTADLNAALARYTFKEGAGTEIHNEIASGPDLEIPATFSVPYKGFLLSPLREFRANRSYARDAVENIAGFVPLGLIVCSYLVWTRTRWKAILTAILFGGLLSFSIEVIQFYIPKRGSGITDIITNTLGAAAGAVLMQSTLVRQLMLRIGLIPPDQK